MISEIYLKHFKCFEELRLPLAPLTVLTGWNSSGKSTVIQALVLLDQTMSEMATSRRLKLNGRQVNLGTFADISNRTSGRGSGEIRLKILDALYSWTFIRDEKTPHLPLVKAVSILTPALNTMNTDDGKLYRLLPEAENFDGDRKKMAGLTYLSADRIAARET